MNYTKAEAKSWAKENWKGLCNVIMPSYTSDLKSLNEAAIRHDVRRNIELCFPDLSATERDALTLQHFKALGMALIEMGLGRWASDKHLQSITTLTGAEFRRVMEAGYRGGPESQGYFPQISGFRVCVDRSRAEYDRIVSLQVPTPDGWAEIDPQAEYTVIVPDFLYGGGDGYEVPKDRFASRPGSELKYLVLDAILRAQGEGKAVGEPVTRDNRRYHNLHEPKERCFN